MYYLNTYIQAYRNDLYVHMVAETAYNKFHPNYVFMPLACNFHLIEAYCGLSGGWFLPACWLCPISSWPT